MRIGNLSGRLTLFTGKGAVDVEKASQGQFGSDPQQIYSLWDQFLRWATGIDSATGAVDAVGFDVADLGPPTPASEQVASAG